MVGEQVNEFLDARRRMIFSQLGDRPLPFVTRRLQRHTDQGAGGELRSNRPAGKSGYSETSDNHFENHFGQQNFLDFARLNSRRLKNFPQQGTLHLRRVEKDVFGGKVFRRGEILVG